MVIIIDVIEFLWIENFKEIGFNYKFPATIISWENINLDINICWLYTF